MKFRARYAEIEAVQVGRHMHHPPQWFIDAINDGRVYYQGGADFFYTVDAEQKWKAMPGDWIVQTPQGDLVVMTSAIVVAAFEPCA